MQTPPSPEIDLDRITLQVRQAVEHQRQRRPAGGAPGGAASGPAPAKGAQPLPLHLQPVEAKDAYTLDELLRYHDEDFLKAAFRAILGRDTDEELPLWLAKLQSGRRTKIEILGRLRFSRAGRERGVKVPSLLPKFIVHKALRIPVAGPVARVALELARLPVHAHRLAQLTTHVERELDRVRAAINGVLPTDGAAQSEASLRRDLERVFAVANERLLEVRELRDRVAQLERSLAGAAERPAPGAAPPVPSELADLARYVATRQGASAQPGDALRKKKA